MANYWHWPSRINDIRPVVVSYAFLCHVVMLNNLAVVVCLSFALMQTGKNSTRVVSLNRRKQARVTSNTYCRLVPGDIIELLYDQQGKYAFKVRVCPIHNP